MLFEKDDELLAHRWGPPGPVPARCEWMRSRVRPARCTRTSSERIRASRPSARCRRDPARPASPATTPLALGTPPLNEALYRVSWELCSDLCERETYRYAAMYVCICICLCVILCLSFALTPAYYIIHTPVHTLAGVPLTWCGHQV